MLTVLVSTWEVVTAECAKLPKRSGFPRVPRLLAAWVAGEEVILRTLQLLRPLAVILGLRFIYPYSHHFMQW